MNKADFMEAYDLICEEVSKYPKEAMSPSFIGQLEQRLDALEADDDYLFRKTETQRIQSPNRRWWRYAAAAAVLILVGGGAYLVFNRPAKPLAQTHEQQSQNDVAPGGNKAVLTLSNGSQIILDSAHKGQLAIQGSTRVVKTDSGKLAYDAAGVRPAEITYNTLSTPRGGQYQLLLPDGTRVWLNAASSIRYPVAFAGNSREVEITGEAYFEVKHISNSHFRVKVRNETVEDIGTAFNINGYADEPEIKTTLVEGAVKMRDVELRAGDQAAINNEGMMEVLHDADIVEAVAWKNGQFKFDKAGIEVVMRQISRWYDVEVSYPEGPPKDLYWGAISRNVSLAGVFKILQASGAHFTITGRKVTVLP
jgi:ferric-dicitrate binding protein FerR (iron transport regulator)